MNTRNSQPVFNGQRLRALRKQRGLSADELARATTLSTRHIWRLESGRRPRVSAVTLARIAAELGTTVEFLVGLTDDPASHKSGEAPNAEVTDEK